MAHEPHKIVVAINFDMHFHFIAMTHRILRSAYLALLATSPACAADLARATSGAIGCPPAEIANRDRSLGFSEMSWSASCRGHTFHCSGERSPACAPELTSSPDAPVRQPMPPEP